MKQRHWELITKQLGFELVQVGVGEDENALPPTFTFGSCLDKNLTEFTDAIVDIGEKAGKEYNIETNMAKMKSDWKGVEFMVKPFKATGVNTVAGFDEAMVLLDEHIVLTQTMAFSPFKKPFEDEIEEWNATLLCVSECIDEWMKVQGAWMYLQPIFDSPDIMKQLPSENKKFKAVDKKWKECMTQTTEDPNALRACTREGLLQKFQDSNAALEIVQRGLRDYLESKRAVFARFYFLSNDELLEILS
jgi:dynein heavy chain